MFTFTFLFALFSLSGSSIAATSKLFIGKIASGVHDLWAMLFLGNTASGQNDSLQSFLDWMGNDATQISNEAASQKLQVDTPVLLSDEQIDLAYQSGWSGRDLTVFTDKRVLVVDAQGKKTKGARTEEYMSE